MLMRSVKTAISVERTLFDRVNDAARRLSIPRSRLFVIAAKEYLERHESQWMLDRLTAAYSDGEDQEDVSRMMPLQREVAEKEEW
jgi:metal-responsive CopG/Arc/MetJ family transcriptional regulator